MTTAETAHGPDSVTATYNNGVAWITLSNPGKRNAFTWHMYDQLEQLAIGIAESPELRAVVFRGDPRDGFAAGTDISQFETFTGGDDGLRYEQRVAAVVAKLLAIPVPTIALVEGAAVGAGLVVAACCDIIIAERGARFGAPIARTLGNCLTASVIARLRSRLGDALTTGMLLSASLLRAEDLTANGFVFRLADTGDLAATGDHILERITGSAPVTLRALKEIMHRLDNEPSLPPDDDLLTRCYGSEDFHEGVDAFMHGRTPHWIGR
jgi:enoyl-CoA hydratase